jgi:hypothetical protein
MNSSKYKQYVKSKEGNLILVPGIPADAPGLMVFGKGQAAQRQRSYSRGQARRNPTNGRDYSSESRVVRLPGPPYPEAGNPDLRPNERGAGQVEFVASLSYEETTAGIGGYNGGRKAE